MSAKPAPEPVYEVRCTVRGCDRAVSTNVTNRLGLYWRWHAAWHRKAAA